MTDTARHTPDARPPGPKGHPIYGGLSRYHHDPIAFLEEITRHRLLHGLLPMEQILGQEQLDALLAAYTAWLTQMRPGETSQLGNKHEGRLTIPVSQLQDKYQAI
jgi:hypothetical protein